jgi:transposase InsO family protein
MVTPAARREAVSWIRERFDVSERYACRVTASSRSVNRYRSRRCSQRELRDRLRELAARKPRYGYRRLAWLLRLAGALVNVKRVYRLYRMEGLAVRRKKRRRLAGRSQPRLAPAMTVNQRWAMDFMEDSFGWG